MISERTMLRKPYKRENSNVYHLDTKHKDYSRMYNNNKNRRKHKSHADNMNTNHCYKDSHSHGFPHISDMHQYSYESETEDLPDIYPPKRMRIARLKAEMKCSDKPPSTASSPATSSAVPENDVVRKRHYNAHISVVPMQFVPHKYRKNNFNRSPNNYNRNRSRSPYKSPGYKSPLHGASSPRYYNSSHYKSPKSESSDDYCKYSNKTMLEIPNTDVDNDIHGELPTEDLDSLKEYESRLSINFRTLSETASKMDYKPAVEKKEDSQHMQSDTKSIKNNSSSPCSHRDTNVPDSKVQRIFDANTTDNCRKKQDNKQTYKSNDISQKGVGKNLLGISKQGETNHSERKSELNQSMDHNDRWSNRQSIHEVDHRLIDKIKSFSNMQFSQPCSVLLSDTFENKTGNLSNTQVEKISVTQTHTECVKLKYNVDISKDYKVKWDKGKLNAQDKAFEFEWNIEGSTGIRKDVKVTENVNVKKHSPLNKPKSDIHKMLVSEKKVISCGNTKFKIKENVNTSINSDIKLELKPSAVCSGYEISDGTNEKYKELTCDERNIKKQVKSKGETTNTIKCSPCTLGTHNSTENQYYTRDESYTCVSENINAQSKEIGGVQMFFGENFTENTCSNICTTNTINTVNISGNKSCFDEKTPADTFTYDMTIADISINKSDMLKPSNPVLDKHEIAQPASLHTENEVMLTEKQDYSKEETTPGVLTEKHVTFNFNTSSSNTYKKTNKLIENVSIPIEENKINSEVEKTSNADGKSKFKSKEHQHDTLHGISLPEVHGNVKPVKSILKENSVEKYNSLHRKTDKKLLKQLNMSKSSTSDVSTVQRHYAIEDSSEKEKDRHLNLIGKTILNGNPDIKEDLTQKVSNLDGVNLQGNNDTDYDLTHLGYKPVKFTITGIRDANTEQEINNLFPNADTSNNTGIFSQVPNIFDVNKTEDKGYELDDNKDNEGSNFGNIENFTIKTKLYAGNDGLKNVMKEKETVELNTDLKLTETHSDVAESTSLLLESIFSGSSESFRIGRLKPPEGIQHLDTNDVSVTKDKKVADDLKQSTIYVDAKNKESEKESSTNVDVKESAEATQNTDPLKYVKNKEDNVKICVLKQPGVITLDNWNGISKVDKTKDRFENDKIMNINKNSKNYITNANLSKENKKATEDFITDSKNEIHTSSTDSVDNENIHNAREKTELKQNDEHKTEKSVTKSKKPSSDLNNKLPDEMKVVKTAKCSLSASNSSGNSGVTEKDIPSNASKSSNINPENAISDTAQKFDSNEDELQYDLKNSIQNLDHPSTNILSEQSYKTITDRSTNDLLTQEINYKFQNDELGESLKESSSKHIETDNCKGNSNYFSGQTAKNKIHSSEGLRFGCKDNNDQGTVSLNETADPQKDKSLHNLYELNKDKTETSKEFCKQQKHELIANWKESKSYKKDHSESDSNKDNKNKSTSSASRKRNKSKTDNSGDHVEDTFNTNHKNSNSHHSTSQHLLKENVITMDSVKKSITNSNELSANLQDNSNKFEDDVKKNKVTNIDSSSSNIARVTSITKMDKLDEQLLSTNNENLKENTTNEKDKWTGISQEKITEQLKLKHGDKHTGDHTKEKNSDDLNDSEIESFDKESNKFNNNAHNHSFSNNLPRQTHKSEKDKFSNTLKKIGQSVKDKLKNDLQKIIQNSQYSTTNLGVQTRKEVHSNDASQKRVDDTITSKNKKYISRTGGHKPPNLANTSTLSSPFDKDKQSTSIAPTRVSESGLTEKISLTVKKSGSSWSSISNLSHTERHKGHHQKSKNKYKKDTNCSVIGERKLMKHHKNSPAFACESKDHVRDHSPYTKPKTLEYRSDDKSDISTSSKSYSKYEDKIRSLLRERQLNHKPLGQNRNTSTRKYIDDDTNMLMQEKNQLKNVEVKHSKNKLSNIHQRNSVDSSDISKKVSYSKKLNKKTNIDNMILSAIDITVKIPKVVLNKITLENLSQTINIGAKFQSEQTRKPQLKQKSVSTRGHSRTDTLDFKTKQLKSEGKTVTKGKVLTNVDKIAQSDDTKKESAKVVKINITKPIDRNINEARISKSNSENSINNNNPFCELYGNTLTEEIHQIPSHETVNDVQHQITSNSSTEMLSDMIHNRIEQFCVNESEISNCIEEVVEQSDMLDMNGQDSHNNIITQDGVHLSTNTTISDELPVPNDCGVNGLENCITEQHVTHDIPCNMMLHTQSEENVDYQVVVQTEEGERLDPEFLSQIIQMHPIVGGVDDKQDNSNGEYVVQDPNDVYVYEVSENLWEHFPHNIELPNDEPGITHVAGEQYIIQDVVIDGSAQTAIENQPGFTQVMVEGENTELNIDTSTGIIQSQGIMEAIHEVEIQECCSNIIDEQLQVCENRGECQYTTVVNYETSKSEVADTQDVNIYSNIQQNVDHLSVDLKNTSTVIRDEDIRDEDEHLVFNLLCVKDTDITKDVPAVEHTSNCHFLSPNTCSDNMKQSETERKSIYRITEQNVESTSEHRLDAIQENMQGMIEKVIISNNDGKTNCCKVKSEDKCDVKIIKKSQTKKTSVKHLDEPFVLKPSEINTEIQCIKAVEALQAELPVLDENVMDKQRKSSSEEINYNQNQFIEKQISDTMPDYEAALATDILSQKYLHGEVESNNQSVFEKEKKSKQLRYSDVKVKSKKSGKKKKKLKAKNVLESQFQKAYKEFCKASGSTTDDIDTNVCKTGDDLKKTYLMGSLSNSREVTQELNMLDDYEPSFVKDKGNQSSSAIRIISINSINRPNLVESISAINGQSSMHSVQGNSGMQLASDQREQPERAKDATGNVPHSKEIVHENPSLQKGTHKSSTQDNIEAEHNENKTENFPKDRSQLKDRTESSGQKPPVQIVNPIIRSVNSKSSTVQQKPHPQTELHKNITAVTVQQQPTNQVIDQEQLVPTLNTSNMGRINQPFNITPQLTQQCDNNQDIRQLTQELHQQMIYDINNFMEQDFNGRNRGELVEPALNTSTNIIEASAINANILEPYEESDTNDDHNNHQSDARNPLLMESSGDLISKVDSHSQDNVGEDNRTKGALTTERNMDSERANNYINEQQLLSNNDPFLKKLKEDYFQFQKLMGDLLKEEKKNQHDQGLISLKKKEAELLMGNLSDKIKNKLLRQHQCDDILPESRATHDRNLIYPQISSKLGIDNRGNEGIPCPRIIDDKDKKIREYRDLLLDKALKENIVETPNPYSGIDNNSNNNQLHVPAQNTKYSIEQVICSSNSDKNKKSLPSRERDIISSKVSHEVHLNTNASSANSQSLHNHDKTDQEIKRRKIDMTVPNSTQGNHMNNNEYMLMPRERDLEFRNINPNIDAFYNTDQTSAFKAYQSNMQKLSAYPKSNDPVLLSVPQPVTAMHNILDDERSAQIVRCETKGPSFDKYKQYRQHMSEQIRLKNRTAVQNSKDCMPYDPRRYENISPTPPGNKHYSENKAPAQFGQPQSHATQRHFMPEFPNNNTQLLSKPRGHSSSNKSNIPNIYEPLLTKSVNNDTVTYNKMNDINKQAFKNTMHSNIQTSHSVEDRISFNNSETSSYLPAKPSQRTSEAPEAKIFSNPRLSISTAEKQIPHPNRLSISTAETQIPHPNHLFISTAEKQIPHPTQSDISHHLFKYSHPPYQSSYIYPSAVPSYLQASPYYPKTDPYSVQQYEQRSPIPLPHAKHLAYPHLSLPTSQKQNPFLPMNYQQQGFLNQPQIYDQQPSSFGKIPQYTVSIPVQQPTYIQSPKHSSSTAETSLLTKPSQCYSQKEDMTQNTPSYMHKMPTKSTMNSYPIEMSEPLTYLNLDDKFQPKSLQSAIHKRPVVNHNDWISNTYATTEPQRIKAISTPQTSSSSKSTLVTPPKQYEYNVTGNIHRSTDSVKESVQKFLPPTGETHKENMKASENCIDKDEKHQNTTKTSETAAKQEYKKGKVIFCDTCKKEATMLCSGCGKVPYCSATCQEKMWPVHLKTCRK